MYLLQLGYLALALVMTIILVVIGHYAIKKSYSDKKSLRNKVIHLIISLLGWHLYLFLITRTGILSDFTFPPKFFLFLVLPAFIFIAIFIYQNRNKEWILIIPPHWLVYYQTFRVFIETLFVISVANGLLNPEITIEGYNFDMAFAFTAPIIAYLVFQRKVLPEKVVVFWNYTGLIIIASIIFLVNASLYFPVLLGSNDILLPRNFADYPYALVPGFLMPSAVFVHVLSITQLTRK